MPRKYDFNKPIDNPFEPYKKLETNYLPIIREEMPHESISEIFFKSGKLSIGHFHLDIPEHKAYPNLNEYLDSAYMWLCQNSTAPFKWAETGNTQSVTYASGQESSISKFSVIITFTNETDALKFGEACAPHNTFKKIHGDFDGKEMPFLNPESLAEKFIRHAKKWLPSSATNNKNPALTLPAPDILKLK